MSEIPNHWALCPRVTTLLKQRALAIGRLEKSGTPEDRETLFQMRLLDEQTEPALCHPEEA